MGVKTRFSLNRLMGDERRGAMVVDTMETIYMWQDWSDRCSDA